MSDRVRMDKAMHDIRNRLAVARANIEAIMDGKFEPTPAHFEVVIQSLDQLSGLLDALEIGGEVAPTLHPVEIDLCDLLHHEYSSVEPLAAKRGITVSVFRCPVPHAACTRFIGDPVRIGEIVSNVLLNAVRYTPRGGTIRVDCLRKANQIEISVADSGPGVTADEREAIFESGVRGSAGQSAPGSGHGLAIAKEFVEAHGGSIVLAPNDEKGARFIIRLPGTLLMGAGFASCQECASG